MINIVNENILNATNKSTLSLHIAAYENSIKAAASDLFDNENIEGLKKEEKFGSNTKQCFTDTLKSQNPFEFPRQQNGEQRNESEVMQFKVSQRLLDSNKPKSSQQNGENDKQLFQPQMPTGAGKANRMFDFDILKGARHVHKPKPASSKPPRSKSTSSLPQTNGTSSKSSQSNGQTSNKPMVAKKPAPVSFEEMMKLASKNLDAKSQISSPPKPLQSSSKPKSPQSLSRSKPSSSSLPSYQSNDGLSKPRQSNGHVLHKPMNARKSTPVSFEERVKIASKNLDGKSLLPPPPKPLQSLSKSKPSQPLSRSKHLPCVLKPKSTSSLNQSNTFSSKPSSKQTNGQTSNKPMTAKNAPPLRFEEMMKLASKNLDVKSQIPPPSKSQQSMPLQSLSRSKPSSSSSYQSNAGLSKPRQSNGQASNKQIKKPLPPVQFNEKRKYPSKTSFKDDRASFRPPKRLRYDEEFDDENDSMDDFIVDDEEEDVRKELQSVLRNFYRSDETVWQQREKEIDLSRMNARYQEIDAEEKRSYRIARMEDMIEEKRGSKALK
uniref:Protein SPT2 homolog n=1 Tax=Panagrolaimus sp. PS1159 TaxID=55785 RepID=A0AC35GA32_9BILA